jgi:hypothetical protein
MLASSPSNERCDSALFVGLPVIGVPQIPKRKFHRKVCCHIVQSVLSHTSIPIRKSDSYSKPLRRAALSTRCDAGPIIACSDCWPLQGLRLGEAVNLPNATWTGLRECSPFEPQSSGNPAWCHFIPRRAECWLITGSAGTATFANAPMSPSSSTRTANAWTKARFIARSMQSRQIGLRAASHGPRLHDMRHRADFPVMPTLRRSRKFGPVCRRVATATRHLKSA